MSQSGRVAVTGAGGFLGSHLAADQARRGHAVAAVDLHLERVRHLSERGRFDLLEGDIADPRLQESMLDGVETVFHLAAAHLAVGVPESEFTRVNVDAVRSLVQSSQKEPVSRPKW